MGVGRTFSQLFFFNTFGLFSPFFLCILLLFPVVSNFTPAIASVSIGRVVTWMANPKKGKKVKIAAASSPSSSPISNDGIWVVSGQCVCIVHPRILLTATHVCFDSFTPHTLRVVYTPFDSSQPAQSFSANLIRYSGMMDVSILLLDSNISPFQPVDILSVNNPLLACTQRISLVCFPLAVDLLIQPGSEEKLIINKISSVVRSPSMLPGEITCLLPKTTNHKGITRSFTIGCSNYTSFAGCSGGGVFLHQLSMNGKPLLLGIHTEAIYQIGQSQLGIMSIIEGEFDGMGATTSQPSRSQQPLTGLQIEPTGSDSAKSPSTRITHKRKRKAQLPSSLSTSTSSTTSVDAATLSTVTPSQDIPTGSTTPEDTPTKKLQLKLADEVQNKSGLGVFVMADTVLNQHAAWNSFPLFNQANVSSVGSISSHSNVANSTTDIDIGIAQLKDEKREQQASPTFSIEKTDCHLLYD